MRFSLRIFPVLSCHSVLVLRVLAADATSPTSLAAAPSPRDWIDPDTRHRVIRLSPDQGGSSLYFHQNGYTPEGDKLILHTRDGALAYNVSPDGKFFAGDGGGAGSVAATSGDGVRLDPPGNGQWIYAFYPSPVRGSSFRDQRPLIDIGVLKSERLVNMANHNYSKDTGVEPNLTFTRDGQWLIFSGNFHTNPGHGHKATTHTYAVEIAKK